MSVHVCFACGADVVLADIRPDGSEVYRHAEEADHPPIPVPADDPAVCRLCGLPCGGRHVVFNVLADVVVGNITMESGEWGLCTFCARQAVQRRWEPMLQRMLTTTAALAQCELTDNIIAITAGLLTGFAENWDGHPPQLHSTRETTMTNTTSRADRIRERLINHFVGVVQIAVSPLDRETWERVGPEYGPYANFGFGLPQALDGEAKLTVPVCVELLDEVTSDLSEDDFDDYFTMLESLTDLTIVLGHGTPGDEAALNRAEAQLNDEWQDSWLLFAATHFGYLDRKAG